MDWQDCCLMKEWSTVRTTLDLLLSTASVLQWPASSLCLLFSWLMWKRQKILGQLFRMGEPLRLFDSLQKYRVETACLLWKHYETDDYLFLINCTPCIFKGCWHVSKTDLAMLHDEPYLLHGSRVGHTAVSFSAVP